MRPLRRTLALLLVTLSLPMRAHAGWSNDPNVNTRLSTTNQDALGGPVSVPDGSGGAFFIWSEYRPGYDVYAQHLDANGRVSPGWPAGGLAVCSSTGDQFATSATSDGVGGFIVAFDDYRNGGNSQVFAQRVSGAGALLWNPFGVPVCAFGTGQHASAQVCSDGAQGAIFVWPDYRNQATTGADIFGQRLNANGSMAWNAIGVGICALTGDQTTPRIVYDGTTGGSILCWIDNRSGNQDIYGMRLDGLGNAFPGWTSNGTVVCNAALNQNDPTLVSDGAFGAVFAWTDTRSGGFDVYAVRLGPGGALASGWPANGLQVTNDPGFQGRPTITSDGANGAILAWEDSRGGTPNDVYAQHLTAGGAASWGVNGISVVAAFGSQTSPTIASDGAGGAIVCWLDARSGQYNNLYAQRLTSAGAVASGWMANGTAVATLLPVQGPTIVSDASGGAIFGFQYSATPTLEYAQRVDQFGTLGVQPKITGVQDVPNDQGGVLKLSWTASPLDAYPAYLVARYQIFRSVPPNTVSSLLRSRTAVEPSRWVSSDLDRPLLVTGTSASTEYWEFVSTVTAFHLPGYSALVPTAADAVSGSNPYTHVMVMAQSSDGSRFWFSDPDSGYSVDNLAPATPSPFYGVRATGVTHLHWGPNTEADFTTYLLYRGSDAGFVPGPGNLLSAQADTGYADATSSAANYYKLIAVDVHGNQSPAALVSPGSTTGVDGDALPRAVWLDGARPNPLRASTRIRYALPRDSRVRLMILDGQGRRVRTVVDAIQTGGWHEATWDGADETHRQVASALYFYRLEVDGVRLHGKVLAIR